jgi:hypothetical protein
MALVARRELLTDLRLDKYPVNNAKASGEELLTLSIWINVKSLSGLATEVPRMHQLPQ